MAKHDFELREASGNVERALMGLEDIIMNPENAEHEHIGETVLYAANLCFHPSFRGKHIEQGLTFLDWVSNNSHLFEGTWTIEELGFTLGRACQIGGHDDIARQWLESAFAGLGEEGMTVTEWYNNPDIWHKMAMQYEERELFIFAVDARAQYLHLHQNHSVDMWMDLAKLLHRMGSTETAMQAAANAFGIDRCNKSVRETLASWNEEWAEMFILEIDCVLKIQARIRGMIGRRRGKALMQQIRKRREQLWKACMMIQARWRFFRARRSSREREEKVLLSLKRIHMRATSSAFGAWKYMYRTRKGSRDITARRHSGIKNKIFSSWAPWAKKSAEEGRALAAIRERQEKLVSKSLKKLFNRILNASFSSLRLYTQRSLGMKKMLRDALLRRKRELLSRWHNNVVERLENQQMLTEPAAIIDEEDTSRRIAHQKYIRARKEGELM